MQGKALENCNAIMTGRLHSPTLSGRMIQMRPACGAPELDTLSVTKATDSVNVRRWGNKLIQEIGNDSYPPH